MVFGVGNYGMNINPNRRQPVSNTGLGRDLRDIYGTTPQLNNFKNYLSSTGYSYEQFMQDRWDAQMMAQEQHQIAKQEAGNTILSNITDIVSTIKGWFGK